jgi:hypothetical protein
MVGVLLSALAVVATSRGLAQQIGTSLAQQIGTDLA